MFVPAICACSCLQAEKTKSTTYRPSLPPILPRACLPASHPSTLQSSIHPSTNQKIRKFPPNTTCNIASSQRPPPSDHNSKTIHKYDRPDLTITIPSSSSSSSQPPSWSSSLIPRFPMYDFLASPPDTGPSNLGTPPPPPSHFVPT